jgi:hypothetical protein
MIVVTTEDVAGHRITSTLGQVYGVVVRRPSGFAAASLDESSPFRLHRSGPPPSSIPHPSRRMDRSQQGRAGS